MASASSDQIQSSGLPITQIIYLKIDPDCRLGNTDYSEGRLWSGILDLLQESQGFRRAYWGRSLEKPENVYLHVVRNELQDHRIFDQSAAYDRLQDKLSRLIDAGTKPETRHVALKEFTPNCQSLAKGAPFVGTAIYLDTDPAWHEGAWPLWTHIVRHVDGVLGCAGGQLLESVDGRQNCYIVFVGWETVEKHHAYHHTKHFADHSIILRCGNAGYAEYGHVVFAGGRVASLVPRL